MKNTLLPLLLIFVFMMISIYGSGDLVGPLTQRDILESFPDWREQMASYVPIPDAVEKLKAIDYLIRIEVILGTWCPDSKKHVSAYFKIMEMVDNPLIVSSYIGVPEEKEKRLPYVEGKDIQRVPTFIVLIQDQEVGRIIEHPEKSIEEDLIEIIQSRKLRQNTGAFP